MSSLHYTKGRECFACGATRMCMNDTRMNTNIFELEKADSKTGFSLFLLFFSVFERPLCSKFVKDFGLCALCVSAREQMICRSINYSSSTVAAVRRDGSKVNATARIFFRNSFGSCKIFCTFAVGSGRNPGRQKHSLLFRVKPRASETLFGIISTIIICEGG